ncbi:hypothetical protein ACOMHN_047196 [Nucella lapillus]
MTGGPSLSSILTSYKLFMKLILKHLRSLTQGNFSQRQKGSMQERVFCLRSDIADILHTLSTLYTAFFDIKDAFGSVDRDFTIHELTSTGYPQAVEDITRNIYSGSSFQVKTAAWLTSPIQRGKGIIQGCPWSVVVFEQGIDKWLRWMEQPYPPASIPNPVLGYMDDVCASSTSEAGIAEAVRKTGQFMDTTGMEVKHRKWGILHGKRSGNRWSKNDTTGDTCLSIQDQPLPMYND